MSLDFGRFRLCTFLLGLNVLNIMLSSCGQKPGTFSTNTDTLTYNVKEVIAGDTAATFTKITYPYFIDEDENTGINTFLLTHFTKESKLSSYKEVCEAFIKQYDSLSKENLDYTQNWTSEKTIKVQFQEYPFISLSNTWYEYTGGAHGNHGTTFINYDCKNQTEIGLNNLFNKDQLTALSTIAEQLFRKQEGLKEGDDYKDYFFDNGIFVLPANFSIRKDGLLFQYGIYEIKPYVAGTTDLFVPYSAINSLILEGNLLNQLLKK